MNAAKIVMKVFSSTMHRDRDALGERVTDWLRSNAKLKINEIRTLQSSDTEFHCVTVVVIAEEP